MEGEERDDGLIPVKILKGREEVKEMMISVVQALCEAELFEEAKMFHDRVLVPASNNNRLVLGSEQIGENTFRCIFQPMVELVLLEMKAAATAPGLTDRMRKARIAEALDLAGF